LILASGNWVWITTSSASFLIILFKNDSSSDCHFFVPSLQGKELYEEAIDWFTGREGHPVSYEKAATLSHALIARNEVVGFCILGSLENFKGNLKKAQEYYFEAYSSGNLIRYSQMEPEVGNFFLGEYFMLADPVDAEKANEHYKESANLGFGASMASYGVNRLIGNEIPPNAFEAKNYLIEGMKKDIPMAYYNFAIYLLSMEKNRLQTAKSYLEYASHRGFKIADQALADWY
jgi:TPR repeat protein